MPVILSCSVRVAAVASYSAAEASSVAAAATSSARTRRLSFVVRSTQNYWSAVSIPTRITSAACCWARVSLAGAVRMMLVA